MSIPEEFREDAGQFPPLLRALLEAELAAGNTILQAGHSFPAPPAGAYFKLSRAFSTRPRQSGDGLKFRDYNSSTISGGFTDERGFYHLLEPPLPPPPEPDMDAIREAHMPKASASIPLDPQAGPASALGKFVRSMVIDYQKWHDGEGYDIGSLRAATAAERTEIEALLLSRGIRDWRDVEALAELNTEAARNAMETAVRSADPRIRSAVTRYAPDPIPDHHRIASLVQALGTADLCGGLSQALDEAADFHPVEVVDALLRAALNRNGEAAVNIAGLLLYVHGKADQPFDWDQRPFLLRFSTENREERNAAFRELCEKIGVEASRYL